ncbi:MAG: hypothetical protein WAO58_10140 [Fimbriimonadaceae bacterium]
MITNLALLLLSIASGQDDAWAKLQERLKAANAIQATLEVQIGPTKQTMAFKLMRPGHVYYKMGPMEMYSDGKEGWMYMSEMKQYMKAPIGSSDMRNLPMIGLEGFWRDDKGPKPGPLVEKEESGKKVWATSLTYPQGAMMAGYQIELSIDKETGLPTKFTVSRDGKSEGGAEYKELLLDPPLKAEDFKFTPPEGAKEMKPGAPQTAASGGVGAQLLNVGSTAPDFKLKTPENTFVGLKATAAKSKAVLINFWFYG